jgi:hypothetical protein
MPQIGLFFGTQIGNAETISRAWVAQLKSTFGV